MPGTPKTLAGPAYVASSATNIYNPSSNTYALVRHIRLVNKDSASHGVILYKGATGASAGGTEICSVTVSATDSKDYYFPSGDKYTTSDFLVGVCADGASYIVVEVLGELYAS